VAEPAATSGPTTPAEVAEAEPEADLAPPSPPVLVPTASIFTRFELREGYDDAGVSRARFVEGEAFFYRARLGLALAPIDVGEGTMVSFQLTPQASGKWGTLGTTVADANLGLHEGYFRVAGSSAALDVGRFELNYGDALVIGNLGWHQTARSFDGARVLGKLDDAGSTLDGFFTVLAEGHGTVTDPALAGDNYFAGLYAGVGPMVSEGMALDLYLLTLITPETEDLPVSMDPADGTADRDGALEATLGVRAKQKVGTLDYRIEAGVQVGDRLVGNTAESAFAYHGDLELGVSFGDVRLAAEGLMASGDDPSTTDLEGWNQLFPTAHKFLGLMDVFGGRTNVASGALHLSGKASADLTLALDGHVFSRLEGAADGYAGAEVDAVAKYALGKGLGLSGVYGIFLPSDDYPSEDAIHYLEVQLGYTLK
jgi:hypothetical protein